MSQKIYCLVSRRPKPVPVVEGEIETNRLQIIACSIEDQGREIAIAEGWSPHDAGGVTTPAKILAGDRCRIFLKNGRNRYEQESATAWFERQCDLLDCPWFPKFVRRMASGEVVALRELQDAYRIHSHGEELPAGTWDQLRRAWNIMASKA